MSSHFFVRMAAALAAIASLVATNAPLRAGGGCGCEAPGQTVYHVHQRCHGHCCRHAPPVGMIVQSAPVMATQAMAAPMMVQPMMVQPVAVVPATAVTFAAAPALTVASAQTLTVPQLSLVQQSQIANSSGISQEQLLRALTLLANNPTASNAATVGAQNADGRSTEERLLELERRVLKLEKNTEDIVNMIDVMQKNK